MDSVFVLCLCVCCQEATWRRRRRRQNDSRKITHPFRIAQCSKHSISRLLPHTEKGNTLPWTNLCVCWGRGGWWWCGEWIIEGWRQQIVFNPEPLTRQQSIFKQKNRMIHHICAHTHVYVCTVNKVSYNFPWETAILSMCVIYGVCFSAHWRDL